MVWHDTFERTGTPSPLLEKSRAGGDKICKNAAYRYMRAARAAAPVGVQVRSRAKGTALKGSAGKAWGTRRPGRLRDSIRVKKSKYKNGGWIVLIGGPDTYYWTFIEWGAWHITRNYKYRNFMLKTFKSVKHMMGRGTR